jgi:hypothetical protein
MEIRFVQQVPGLTIEPMMMFAHSTHLADTYTSTVEQIYLPERYCQPFDLEITVRTGETGPRRMGGRKWKLYYKLSRLFLKPVLDYSNQFIYDARHDTDCNIAHVIEHNCAPILLARRLLSEHFNHPINVHVVLRKGATQLARRVYASLGIRIIETDDSVRGNLIQLAPYQELAALEPDLFNIDIPNYNPHTPERIFLPRRGNRQIINIKEVTRFLEARGFTTYYLEDMTPSEQWSLLRNAKVVVAGHGAGCAHFIFNRLGLDAHSKSRSGLRMIEIFSPNFVITRYRYFASILNGRWCGVRGQATPEGLRQLDFSTKPRDTLKSPIKDPFRVDLKTLQMALEHLEVDRPQNSIHAVSGLRQRMGV